jgi:hypothetical protein
MLFVEHLPCRGEFDGEGAHPPNCVVSMTKAPLLHPI